MIPRSFFFGFKKRFISTQKGAFFFKRLWKMKHLVERSLGELRKKIPDEKKN
jgi:hypothetical protein